MNLSFRTVCEAAINEDDPRANPIELAKERLLSLEGAIERRYLKAPLGHRFLHFFTSIPLVSLSRTVTISLMMKIVNYYCNFLSKFRVSVIQVKMLHFLGGNCQNVGLKVKIVKILNLRN